MSSNLAQDLLRNMSDRQLQEVLSAISTAASQTNQVQASNATPQRKPAAGTTGFPFSHLRMRACTNTQFLATPSFAWQNSYLPEPQPASKQRRTTKPSAPQKSTYPQVQQHEQNPISSRYFAAFSKPTIPTTGQALQTTYASRLRTGSTVLMQPVLQSTISLNPRGASRRAGMVNYADPGSGDEIEVDPDTDDSDFNSLTAVKPLGRTSSFRNRGTSGYATPQSSNPIAPGIQGSSLQPLGKQDLDQSYLGLIPPSKFLTSKPAAPTRHEYL